MASASPARFFYLLCCCLGATAIAVSAVLLLTSLVMYFSGKVLMEVPSLKLLVFAASSFMTSFDGSSRGIILWIWITIATLFLYGIDSIFNPCVAEDDQAGRSLANDIIRVKEAG